MKVRMITPEGKIKQLNFYGLCKRLDDKDILRTWAIVSETFEDIVYLEFPQMILFPPDYIEADLDLV